MRERLSSRPVMDLVVDLLQGAGLAAAIGIRPFLPVLLAGALAAENLGLDFDGTDFSFLEGPIFLLAIVVLLAAFDLVQRRVGRDTADRAPWVYGLLGVTLALGLL